MRRLLGAEAVDGRGQRLGRVIDVAVEPVRGSIAFVTIRYGAGVTEGSDGADGKMFLVPPGACRIEADRVVVDVSPAVFERSPGRV